MDILKKEINKAVHQIIRDFLRENIDEVIRKNRSLSARYLFDQIDSVIDIDVEEYLLSLACEGRDFTRDRKIPDDELEEYQKRFEIYQKEYDRLKKLTAKPVHMELKEKIDDPGSSW